MFRVVEDDQLAVARAPDVELDHVRPEADRLLEGGQRVLGDTGAPGAAMCNDAGTLPRRRGKCYGSVRCATTTESARMRMAIRSPSFR